MLLVFALDMLAAAVLLPSWLALGLFGAACALMYWIWPRKAKQAAPSGWVLGSAVELTNPDRPTRIAAASISPKILNLGMLFIGAPGSGKTESATLGYIQSLRSHSPGCGWAYFEGKGDTDIYKKCVAMGSKPDHFFSSELPGSETINIFAGEAPDVTDRLSKVLIGETTSTSFFSDEQRAVLARVIPLLRCLPVATNLRDLYVALTVQDAGNELLRRAREAGADPVDLELARGWFSQHVDQRVKNISGLLNRLFIFVNGPYADRLNAYQPDIDVSQIVSAGQSVYFHLPLTSFAKDVAISIIETFGVEARRRQLAGTEDVKMFAQLYDDWGAFFHDGFGPFSARCRSAAMPLSFGFQSRAQLNAVSHTFADELDDTIATKIVFRVQGEKTAEYAVTLLGDYETLDAGTSADGSAQRQTDATSVRYIIKPRIDPRQLRELQPGEAYVSTLAVVDSKMKNPLWHLRLPLPDFPGWRDVPLPAGRGHIEGEGLSFWSRYMNPARLAEIHEHTQGVAKQREQARKLSNKQEQAEATKALEKNQGFALDINK
jgi:hypothetical protein